MADDPHRGVPAALRRIRLIAGYTLTEALGMKLVLLLAAVGGLLVIGGLGLREFNFGTAELKFLGDFGLGAIGLLGTVFAALVTAQLFFGDLLNGAAACVLTRPVRRWEYVAGQSAGVAALLAIFTTTLGILLAGLLHWRGRQLGVEPVALSALLGACALHWMKFTLVAAMTLLVSSYAGSALFAGCAGLLLALVGHLRPYATGDALNWLRVWPNLAAFDADLVLGTGSMPVGYPLLHLAGYWVACLSLMGGLASYVFKHREL